MLPRVVFIDVDDTLVRSIGTKRIPIPSVVNRVHQLKQEGVLLYLWSSGGAEYAHASAIELGIEDYFTSFFPKPQAYIDDQPVKVNEWRFCSHYYPSQASDA
jgi:predicted HAD superfamily phosphohydrolase YqeG